MLLSENKVYTFTKPSILMLGQYRILSEILLFAAGMAITSYVVISFSNVRDFIVSVSIEDKLENTANNIANAVLKASLEKSFLTVEIPEKASEEAYTVMVVDETRGSCDKGDDCFLNLNAGDISVSKRLFNISQDYDIKGDVHSTARFITIYSSDDSIILGR
jgi:hypothetical protein